MKEFELIRDYINAQYSALEIDFSTYKELITAIYSLRKQLEEANTKLTNLKMS